MSSKKDLVEAHSFNRRRLVTAFLSGAPGGREVEPVRYGRALIGGLVLAVMLVAGAAVSGFLKPSVSSSWMKHSLVIGKTSGSRFVADKGTLYPVINITSARLLLAKQGKLPVEFVPDSKIAAQRQGQTLGIPGAPDLLPTTGHLVNTGWTACLGGSSAIQVRIDRHPAAAATPDQALRVSADGQQYIISGTHRYALGSAANADLRALGLDGQPPVTVPGEWLDLFAEGSPLQPFTVPGSGRHVHTGAAGLDVVGAPVSVAGRHYVLGSNGQLLPLTPFAWTIYRADGAGAQLPVARLSEAQAAALATDSQAQDAPYPADWPRGNVTPFTGASGPCGLLVAHRGQTPVTQLATSRSSQALPQGPGVDQQVQPGHGALVRATAAGNLDTGRVFLVDSHGTSYAVGDQTSEPEAQAALGYGHVTAVPVPQAWLALLASGPELSRQAADRPVPSR